MKPKKKKFLTTRNVMVLFLLMLVSMMCLPGLSARFFTSATQTSQARVATFNIDFKYGENNASFTQTLEGTVRPGIDGEENGSTLHIVNKSEVAVSYNIIISRVTNNIPLEIALYGSKNEKLTASEYKDEATGMVTYEYNVEAAPSGQSDTYGLQLSWDMDTAKEDGNLQYMGMVDYYTITVTATQID
jgi:hypothetical protein